MQGKEKKSEGLGPLLPHLTLATNLSRDIGRFDSEVKRQDQARRRLIASVVVRPSIPMRLSRAASPERMRMLDLRTPRRLAGAGTTTEIFAEIEANQKELIILAQRKLDMLLVTWGMASMIHRPFMPLIQVFQLILQQML